MKKFIWVAVVLSIFLSMTSCKSKKKTTEQSATKTERDLEVKAIEEWQYNKTVKLDTIKLPGKISSIKLPEWDNKDEPYYHEDEELKVIAIKDPKKKGHIIAYVEDKKPQETIIPVEIKETSVRKKDSSVSEVITTEHDSEIIEKKKTGLYIPWYLLVGAIVVIGVIIALTYFRHKIRFLT